jgi:plastocyanin
MRRASERAGGVVVALVAVLGCGGSGGGDGPSPQQPTGLVITISGLRFSPLALSAPPGATITVVNADGMPHSVTSQATAGSYVRGAVGGVSFDTGEFSSGQRTIVIPANAQNGAVVPYFCTSHLGTMATPNGTITIGAAAAPTASPPSGY